MYAGSESRHEKSESMLEDDGMRLHRTSDAVHGHPHLAMSWLGSRAELLKMMKRGSCYYG